MKIKHIVVSLLLLGAIALGAEKSIIHVSHVNTRTIAITCGNGGDPTGSKTGDVLLISCGK